MIHNAINTVYIPAYPPPLKTKIQLKNEIRLKNMKIIVDRYKKICYEQKNRRKKLYKHWFLYKLSKKFNINSNISR